MYKIMAQAEQNGLQVFGAVFDIAQLVWSTQNYGAG